MQNCKRCNSPIKLGGFAYNQDICFDCVKKDVETIQSNFDTGSWEQELIQYMFDVLSEVHGLYKRK